jgi:hypothetical protein
MKHFQTVKQHPATGKRTSCRMILALPAVEGTQGIPVRRRPEN